MQASLNASTSASIGESSYKLTFGVDLRMPWNFHISDLLDI